MLSLRHRIALALLILSCSLLPGVYMDCNLEDGELIVNLDEIGFILDDEGLVIDIWLEGDGEEDDDDWW